MSKYLPTDKNVKTVTDLREHPVELVDGVKEEGPYYIFHHSKPKAVVLSTEAYSELVDRVEELQDALYAQQLDQEEFDSNDYLTEKELTAALKKAA